MSGPKLERVVLTICELCLDGKGGECHVPGCALWLSTAPDLSIRDKVEQSSEQSANAPASAATNQTPETP